MKTKEPTCPAKPLSEAVAEASRVGFSALPDGVPERQTAWRDMETAVHKAGVYREALRGINTLRTEPPPDGFEARVVRTWALSLAAKYDAPTLKVLADAPTFEEREKILADLHRAAEEHERQIQKDNETKTARELTARKAAEAKAEDARREEAERKRKVDDVILCNAEKATAEKKKRQRLGRLNGKKGAPKPKDGEDTIRKAVAAVLKSLNKGGSMKSACMYQIGQHKLKFGAVTVDAKKHWPALAKHVRKEMPRV